MQNRENLKVQYHDLEGTIRFEGLDIILSFFYEGEQYEFFFCEFMDTEESIKIGCRILEEFVSNAKEEGEKIYLHQWYLIQDERLDHIGQGNVCGHTRLADGLFIHTSRVLAVCEDFVHKELIMITQNSYYHCPMEACSWERQGPSSNLIPDYAKMEALFRGKATTPTIERRKVLLVIADYCEYYFHSLVYIPKQKRKPCTYRATPHLGMFQDSFLIRGYENKVDLRYFPHYKNLEFYSELTDDAPWFVENIGHEELYVKTTVGVFLINPGERKEITAENAEKEEPFLFGGDLYPALFID